VVAIIRLYIAWGRSWVQYATTNKKNQKTKKKQKTKKQNKKLWCRDLEHLDSIYTYIISGNRILSGEEQGSRGAAGGAEFLKAGGVVGWNVSFLAMWPGESVLSQGECLFCVMWCLRQVWWSVSVAHGVRCLTTLSTLYTLYWHTTGMPHLKILHYVFIKAYERSVWDVMN